MAAVDFPFIILNTIVDLLSEFPQEISRFN